MAEAIAKEKGKKLATKPVEKVPADPVNLGTEKKRGWLLTAWLVLMLVANFLSAASYLFFNSSFTVLLPAVPIWTFYIYGVLALANFVFTIFLFKWKKWAFYAFLSVAVVAFIMNIAIGLGVGTAIFGAVGVLILYLILRPKWALLE
jgi:hypothetical protein